MRVEDELAAVLPNAERFAGVDALRYESRWRRCVDGDYWGYESPGRYSLALSKRLAIREAKRRGAPAVLLLEDDVVLHPNFMRLVEAVELPEDWGIFYFGCAHSRQPRWVGRRTVSVEFAVDNHAVAIRAPYYDRVMEVWNRRGKVNPGVARASDQFLGSLAKEIPAYACYPNLAWQEVSNSDLMGKKYSNYTSDGKQKNWVTKISHLLPELVVDHKSPIAQVKLGLLFLTRGDVNHPRIWSEFIGQNPNRVRVLSHPKEKLCDIMEYSGSERAPEVNGAFLNGSVIPDHYETKWGSISLVRATRALLLEALKDESLSHFALLSENCVPAKSLSEILRRIEVDPRSQFGFQRFDEASTRNRARVSTAPRIHRDCWRFQSQWWLMDRVAAFISSAEDFTPLFSNMFAPDESYFATVLAMQGYPLDGEVNNLRSTWTWWEKDARSPVSWGHIPPDKVAKIIHSGALFARKFPAGSNIGSYNIHKL